jgi:hypothetical protein
MATVAHQVRGRAAGETYRRREIPLRTYRELNVVDPKLAKKMVEFRDKLAAMSSGYPVLADWHPVIPEGWGTFPQAPVQRVAIYRGDASRWAYSHHQGIVKFGDKYVASWSNGLLHEDYVGQEPHLAWSADGLHWSEPQVVAHTPLESGLVRTNAGLCAAGGSLYNYVCVARDFGRDKAPPGMCSLKPQDIALEVYVTMDLRTWKHYPNLHPNVYLFEGPRPTRKGKLLCCGSDYKDKHAVVLVWDSPDRLADPPRAIHLPPSPDGVRCCQGTWYQTDDGRIWIYLRDVSESGRLALTYSDDGGQTWSDILRTDFPNTFSRAFAGKLSDGRYYIVGNNYDILLDRRHLQLAISDDGYRFDRQYTLVEGNSTRRINGRHKEDGYQYPNCYADGDRLFVIYSVNKEDVEIGIVDITQVP